MTLKNSYLGDRLNKAKNDLSAPNDSIPGNPIVDFISGLSTLLFIIAKSLAVGYAGKLIFDTDWKILGIFCVGFTVNLILNHFQDIIHNN